MKKISSICILISITFLATAQAAFDDEIPETNYGIHFGLGVSAIRGTELERSRPGVGFNAGLYLYGEKAKKKKNNYQIELNSRFAIYRFNNQYLGNTAYTKISSICLEMPILWRRRLGNFKVEGTNHFLLGIQPAYMLKSALYTGPEFEPLYKDNYLLTWKNLPLLPINISAVAGYRFSGKLTGFQAALKVGLLNINNNFNIPSVVPKTGKGGSIQTMSVEFGISF